jgi:PAS domain S-box-containing protein
MNNEPKEISCFNTYLIIKQSRILGISDDILFNGIPHESIAILYDHMEWTTFSIWTLLATNIENAMGCIPGILEQMVFDAVLSESGAFQLLFIKVAPLKVISRGINKHYQTHLNRNIEVTMQVIRNGLVHVAMRPIDKSRYNRFYCELFKGAIRAFMLMKGYKNTHLAEIACGCTSTQVGCSYRLSWSPRGRCSTWLHTHLHIGSSPYFEFIDYLEENQTVLRRQYDELRTLTKELRQNQNRYRLITDNSTDVIWTLDVLTNKFTFISPSIMRLRGYTPEEGMQQSIQDVLTPESYNLITNLLIETKEAVALGKQPETLAPFIVDQPCKDGSIISTEVVVTLITKDNMLIELLGISRDITEKRRMDEQLQNIEKVEALGALAGGIAHDFNNLLSGVFGYIDIAKELIMEGAHEQGLKNISKALGIFDRATSLTQQLLTFSKGGMPIKKTTKISSLIANAATFALTGSNISPILDIPEDLWYCDIDENQISQVIDNIIINARQAMPSGGILNISAANIIPNKPLPLPLQPGYYVSIVIRDLGDGISQEHLNKIFDPFFTTKEQGSGLGLAMAYSILSKHGGCITVESEPGKGAQFTVYLPASQNSLPGTHKAAAASSGSGGKILVMDDEEYIREIATQMLEQLGYTVVASAHGAEAVEQFADANASASPFSAVILDFTVPGGMGGKETMKHLLAIESSVLGIVSSGYADDPVMTEPQQFGFAAKLQKPYSKQELASVLQDVLNTSIPN